MVPGIPDGIKKQRANQCLRAASRSDFETAGLAYKGRPLNGIWATAPYLHNGSVPTLWHLLHPDDRPALWTRTEDGYDRDKVGLEATTFEKLPDAAKTPAQRREYFDTRLPGKNAAGHPFPDELSEAEKRAVLEYLKTL